VTMHSVPGWVGDDHCITAEIEGVKAVVDICSSTSAIAGWSAVALLRNLASPVCFY
jgi:aspartate dehydrogenase